ncbi:hypothetical protein [Bradyrhizobium sp. 1(2017)]|uniref:hypothetical protein n=1 Tax=Bradyrhizobium sp. 1(2017) TaxID=1404888 RepID=UPI00140F4819|nr:hypothetical protein [Bradyrhizobium sp. 1(2017)]QIO36064.1 hypothetical protein HAP40_31760 [Bradyrhizobium sp. 1(2017)]
MTSADTTTNAGLVETSVEGEPAFSLYSSLGTAPDANNSTRQFLPANTAVDIFGDGAGGEKVAWILA